MNPDVIAAIIDKITKANPDRNFDNLSRRIFKLFEEIGEVSEAYLNYTSLTPTKKKTFEDYLEEIADVLIVAIDIAVTPLPSETDIVVQEQMTKMIQAWRQTIFPTETLWEIAHQVYALGNSMFTRTRDDLNVHAVPLAGYAFLLANEAFSGDIDGLMREIDRKLAKWEKNRKKGSPD